MGSQNIEQSNGQQRAQGRVSQVPPQVNVIAAASYVRQVFEHKRFTYGIMGGIEMLCLGHRREIPDVHIAYDDKDFNRMKAKLGKDHRVQLPDGMNSLLPSTILVRTGPYYQDLGCTNPATIEVHLVPSGSHGTPPNGTLSNNLVLLSLKTDGVLKTYKGLNMLYLVRTLVHSSKVHGLAWDPRNYIVFLCQQYSAEVNSVRGQLDQKAVQQDVLVTAFFIQLPFADQRICYQALSGQEPPPIMAVTSPTLLDGHMRSQSASELLRPRVSSINSTTAPKKHTSLGFLSPPRSEKTKPAQKYTADNGKLYIPSPPLTNLAGSRGDSRLRYRPVTAPNNRRNSPEIVQTNNTSYARTKDIPYNTRQTTRPLQTTQSLGTPQPVVAKGNQTKSKPSLAAMIPQMNSSSTNVNTGHTGSLAPKGPVVRGAAKGSSLWQPPQRQIQVPPVELSSTPAPYNPGQQHLKSHLGLADAPILVHSRLQSVPIISRPLPPQARNVRQGPLPVHSDTPVSRQEPRKSHVVSSEKENVLAAQYVVEVEEQARGLRLVGPEGLYQSSRKLEQASQPTQKTEPASTSPPLIFELDAGQESSIVAELSADIDAVIQTSSRTQISAQPNWYNDPSFLDSPIRPPHARTASAPLPTSLAVGRSSPPRASSPISTSPPRTAPPVNNTNTSRNSTSIPPSSAPRPSSTSSLAPAPLTVYKAYQPPSAPITPPSLPLTSPPLPASVSISPPTSPPDNASSPRPRSFGKVRDIDGMQHYLQTHNRSVSHESPLTEQSTDASRLAMEYRAELPDFGRGYSFRFRS